MGTVLFLPVCICDSLRLICKFRLLTKFVLVRGKIVLYVMFFLFEDEFKPSTIVYLCL